MLITTQLQGKGDQDKVRGLILASLQWFMYFSLVLHSA